MLLQYDLYSKTNYERSVEVADDQIPITDEIQLAVHFFDDQKRSVIL